VADKESKLFKDELGISAVENLAQALQAVRPDFPAREFVAANLDGLGALEMKARITHISGVMQRFIPASYPDALAMVQAAILLDDDDGKPRLGGFAAWPLLDWVETQGLGHPEISLAALHRMTGRFTAEFAIRPYLEKHTELCLETLPVWATDPDPHVRRLVSEGTRPRLPWGRRLALFMADPAPVLELLEVLKDDPEEYVRRSVANNLNDIAKDHPDLAASVAAHWMKNATPDRQRLVKHGLRTLVKQGHTGALEALGYTTRPEVEVRFATGAKMVRLGEDLTLEATITSTGKKAQKLVVDFVVHYRKANGTLAPKIFKWKVLDLPPGGQAVLKKRQRMVSRSVRNLYPGKHAVGVLVAGRERASREFRLTRAKG